MRPSHTCGERTNRSREAESEQDCVTGLQLIGIDTNGGGITRLEYRARHYATSFAGSRGFWGTGDMYLNKLISRLGN